MSVPDRTEPELGWKDRRLQSYLKERAEAGDRYFKSKHIAEELDLSSKEIGASMDKLRVAATTVDVERWTRMTSPATWYVKPTPSAARADED